MAIRLDQLLYEKGLAASLKEAQGYILAGQVVVDNHISDKPGKKVPVDCNITVKKKNRFVSRGGRKIAAGIEHFGIDVSGMVCVDIGASSGGFTDCLLQKNAAHVFAIDVAYGQLAWEIRNDQRVTVIERFNARFVTQKVVPEPIDLAVIDASFISLTRLLPPLLPLFQEQVRILALVKPQFELPRDKVGPKGVVTEESCHQEAIAKISDFAELQLGLQTAGTVPSPILGPKGNKEFIIYLRSPQCGG